MGFAPSKDALVDCIHNCGIRDHPHQMCGEATIESMDTLFGNDKLQSLIEPSIFELAIDKWLTEPRSQYLQTQIRTFREKKLADELKRTS